MAISYIYLYYIYTSYTRTYIYIYTSILFGYLDPYMSILLMNTYKQQSINSFVMEVPVALFTHHAPKVCSYMP